ncbi:IS5/IS1182 family transposase, partial [Motilimonas pumila]
AFWEEGHPRNEAVSALKADELKEWKFKWLLDLIDHAISQSGMA